MRLQFCLIWFILTNSLYALEFSRVSEAFDKDYSIEILESCVEVYPPGTPCPLESLSQSFPEFWCVRHAILLANGLVASNTMFYDNSSYHKLNTQFECQGNVNIVFSDSEETSREFSLIFENNRLLPVDLWRYKTQAELPKILCLEQLAKTIPHWFYDEYTFEYDIKLTDGASWIVPERNSVWANPWPLHSYIIKMGTSRQPILLNIDAITEKDSYISHEQCLKVRRI
jgi:hypothetical protein